MTKKILSFALSLILVIGLLPAMPASAAGETVYLTDDFESYDVGVYSSGTTLSADGVAKWTLNASVTGEIVSMTGYDGKPTKALKYTNTAGSGSVNAGAYRLVAKPDSNQALGGADMAGKVFVQELKLWVPENVTLPDGTVDRKRPNRFYIGYGVTVYGDTIYAAGDDYSTGVKMPTEEWVKFTVVLDYTKWAASKDPISCTMYMNDECIYHGVDTAGNMVSASASLNYSMISHKNTDAAETYDDIHFIIDDVNWYYSPASATASSAQAGSSEVSRSADITVDFTEKVFESDKYDDGIISADNVEIIAVSDGTEVGISSVTLSEDSKKLIIDPAGVFEYDTEYQVTVSGIKDIYGILIADYIFTFKTVEMPPISTTEPVFRKENISFPMGAQGAELDALENGYISYDYSITNNSTQKAQDVLMFVVLWENNAIKTTQVKRLSLGTQQTTELYGGFNVTDAANSMIETYIWDGFDKMTSLSDSYTFDKNGLSLR